MMTLQTRRRSGFTLIELSVVLLIIAVITGLGLSIGMVEVENARYIQTMRKMEVIDKALATYAKINRRIPCAASERDTAANATYGYERIDNASGWCSYIIWESFNASRGAVPVKTLGLPIDFMFDGWGRRIIYVPSDAMANRYQNMDFNARISRNLVNNDRSYGGGGNLAAGPVMVYTRPQNANFAQSDLNRSATRENLNTTYSQGPPMAYFLISYGPNGWFSRRPSDGGIDSFALQGFTANSMDLSERMNSLRIHQGQNYAAASRRYKNESNPWMQHDDILMWRSRAQLRNYDDR